MLEAGVVVTDRDGADSPRALAAVRRFLATEVAGARRDEALALERALVRALELEGLVDRRRSRERDLVVAMICARLLSPGSKLATPSPRRHRPINGS